MTHRIFGAEMSPYSVKVRSYFRYKGIPHQWIERSQAELEEFQKYAKLPLVPLVVMPDDSAIQDSTPIIEKLEAIHAEPSIHPSDPALAFLSALIEEFGDEWGNKWMFHYRWAAEADQWSAGRRLAKGMLPDADDEAIEGIAGGIVKRMTGRVWFVGSSPETAPIIAASYAEGLAQLDAHLSGRAYLFGGRPSFADFGLWGQIYNAWTDPTAGAIVRESAPAVCAWIERMLDPKPEGDGAWEDAAALLPTLEPFLATQVGALFLPWSDANAKALESGAEEFTAQLGKSGDIPWTQKPQKYHARSLKAIRAKYAEAAGNAELDAVLERTDCKSWLAS
jgi:glutathione S-transferase